MADKPKQAPEPSSFAERLDFARVWQAVQGVAWEDQQLASHIGISRGQMSDVKRRAVAPAAGHTLGLAQALEVDPGWLAFGEDSKAPAPEGFALWLGKMRALATVVASRAKEMPLESFEPKGRAAKKATAKRAAPDTPARRKGA